MRSPGWSILALGVATAAAAQSTPERPSIGSAVKHVEVLDIRYLRRSLTDLGGTKGTICWFVSDDCPLVLRYMPRMRTLHREFRSTGFAFAAVNVAPGDTVRSMATCAVDHRMPFPFLKDPECALARACGVDRTNTVVVLDGKQRLCYRGRIDGSYRFSGASPNPGRADLVEALRELSAGKPVSCSETSVEGCAITWPIEPRGDSLTFCRDIAPLVQRHCQDCHRRDGAAPFALETFEDVASRGQMVAEVVRQRRMPPWYASDKYGKFANHRGLSEAEVRTLVGWVNSGMKQGDRNDLPKPRDFPKGEWRIGEPDLVLKLPQRIRLPSEGYVAYKYFVFPYQFKEDTWVERVEILPENRRVLHHANLASVRGFKYEQSGFITGQVPGGDPMVLDPGTALLIPKGSVLAIQCHYVTTGKPEVDRLRIGLRFPRQVVQRRLHHIQVYNTRFKIPPHAPHHLVSRVRKIPFAADGVGMFAHMHLRGTDMRFVAIEPDGTRRTLLLVPNYNFEWQQSYRWHAGKVSFAPGTRIEVEAHYDNSKFNPFNPDPTRVVPHGDNTDDEMMWGFVFFLCQGEALGLRIDPKTGHVLP
ncbi:MAG: redoxin domain-containing protein [Planctomycetes bacterium]|nr:redoxin domain-containing protein [Planctomycetota bacterium]